MSLKQMQLLDGASAGKQEPVRIMGFDCVCGRRMEVSAEQGVVPAPQRKPLTDDEAIKIVQGVVSTSVRPIGAVALGLLVLRASEAVHGIT